MSSSGEPFTVDQLDHVHVFVSDRYEAASWYERILGLKTVPEFKPWAVPGGPLIVSSDDGNTKLALFETREPKGSGEKRKTVAFRIDGSGFCHFLERLAAHPVFDEAGAGVSSLEAVDHELVFSVYFNDPDGNSLELTTYDYEYVSRKREGEHTESDAKS